MYTGTADTSVPYQDTLNYYERVISREGGLARTEEFCRYFLVPGMRHGSGGAGLGEFGQVLARFDTPADPDHDIVAALVRWVEDGVAPDRLVATAFKEWDHPEKGIRLQRPIYPYPLFPQYVGGNPASPDSFRPAPHARGGVPVPAKRYLN
jgi:feruloyl esterase